MTDFINHFRIFLHSSVDRQQKLAALTFFTVTGNIAPQLLCKLLGDTQTQPGTAIFSHNGRISLGECFKNIAHLVDRHADTRVGNGKT